ncbi:MAG: lipoate--protein ligase family protein [Candidatus Cloacimonetes bacterium]|nr:lipoate--protein ligase family protein [Candidatus Cloacimonadota bacterium]MBL7086960.1 lipoate--protein ligase family protein [Candidatus Cloacimonadota bacterium]
MTNNSWRFINSGKMSPAENMAIDEAILQGVSKGISPQTVRVYDWNPPTISFGFHQNIEKQIDIDRVKKYGFGIVRRPTGGRAVLHYDELTYAVIALNSEILKGSILDSYRKISNVLLNTLNEIGIEADMENSLPVLNEQKNWTNPCFASASKYEIHYKHKKIIGSAQMRKHNVLLQHGSILLNHNQELMAEFLAYKEDKKKHLKKILSQKTIAINQIVDSPISFFELANILKKHFEQEFYVCFKNGCKLNEFEQSIFNSLYLKYKRVYYKNPRNSVI